MWCKRFLDTYLEKKRTSITRLKRQTRTTAGCFRCTWKEKNLDYEIETRRFSRLLLCLHFPWKEKNLDYEIETRKQPAHSAHLSRNLKRKEPRLRDWNREDIDCHKLYAIIIPWKEKNLDYEIETGNFYRHAAERNNLEKKRTSITRLKLEMLSKRMLW